MEPYFITIHVSAWMLGLRPFKSHPLHFRTQIDRVHGPTAPSVVTLRAAPTFYIPSGEECHPLARPLVIPQHIGSDTMHEGTVHIHTWSTMNDQRRIYILLGDSRTEDNWKVTMDQWKCDAFISRAP